jgi:hypothetical protein
VKLAQEPEQTAEEDTQAAFGVPPVDALVEENKPDENSLTFLPDEDQQSAVDAYNEALIVSVVQSWSFGEVTVDALRDIPGDAFDVLLDHARGGDEEKAKDGTEGSSDSLADDPTAP